MQANNRDSAFLWDMMQAIVFRTTHSDIDWRRIIGLRNILAHQYELIRQEILWDIVTSLLPPLLNQIETLLPSSADEDD